MSLSESPQFMQSLDTSAAVVGKDETSPKAKEREERFRIARERQREEQRRKLEELRESIERAEEFRRKQEENRRQKIEEMRRRDEQHRASVEERRKKLLDEENERKQAILRKTEAKLEQTKQKKISGTSVALFSSYSGALNTTHTTPLGAADFRSTRNLENTFYESSVPTVRRRTTLIVRRKRLSSSVDQIARIRATLSENQPSVQEVEPSSSGSLGNGSASPIVNNRVKSIGSIRKSRADLRRTTESLEPVVNGKATPAEQTRNLVPTRTGISKSVSSSEALGVNTTLKSNAKSPAFPRASVLTAKFVKGPPMFSTPPAKLPLTQPKTLAPRSLPKPLKDTSSQTSVASNKGIVKAVHDLSIQIQPLQLDKKKELPLSDANQKQKVVSANGEPSSADTADRMSKNSVEEEYKVKLTEKRRLAREKAEREAEEERQRVEDERKKEEERLQMEEEEQRRHEEEVEEARKQEEERFRLAVEEAERQRKQEEEKQEAERQEKLAAEMKAQEEAERKEKEREEKFRREEEERQERKKRIELIMKRVKTDDSSHLQKEVKELKAAEPAGGDDSEMKFVSPLLRQIMGSKLRGKAAVVGSSPATSEPSNDESKTLKTDVMKANLDELLDEKSDVSSALSLNLQSQFITEDTVSKDYETTNEANLGLQTSQSTNSNEDSGTDSSTPTMTSSSTEEAISDASHHQLNLEIIDLSPPGDKVTKASDDNQNWSIPAKQNPDDASTVIPEQPSLPDLPRIAFDESTVKHSQNKLPDILL